MELNSLAFLKGEVTETQFFYGILRPIEWNEDFEPISFTLEDYHDAEILLDSNNLQKQLQECQNCPVEIKGYKFTNNFGEECIYVKEIKQLNDPVFTRNIQNFDNLSLAWA